MEACARPGVETEDVVGDVVLGPHQVPVLAVEGVTELGHGHRQVVLLTVAQQDVLQGTASCLNCHHVTQIESTLSFISLQKRRYLSFPSHQSYYVY